MMVTTRQSGADDLAPSARLHSRHAKQRKNVTSTPTESPVIPIRAEAEDGDFARALSSLGRSPTTIPIFKPINPMNDSSTPSTRAPEPVRQSPNTPGSSRNPIPLTEDPPQRNPTGKDNRPVPHMFQDRHSKLYTWKAPPISSWAPKPADGSTFTGHTGQDMYRMRKAKMACRSQQDVPPQMAPPTKHRMAVQQQMVLQQQRALQQQSVLQQQRAVPAIQHSAPPPMRYSLHTLPPLSGQQTHTRGLQYIQEYSGSTRRKRKMSADHDQGSEPGSGYIDQDTTVAPHMSAFQQTSSENAKKIRPIFFLPDVQLQLASIIERASLLTSLLRMYPQSTDPDGSRKEIAMLTSVQSQHLANWLNFEDRQMRKPLNPHTPQPGRRTGSLLAKSLERKSGSSTMVEVDLRRRQDDKMRQLFSADAEHWQDGSGLSVADVYAETGVASDPPSEGDDGTDAEGTAATIASPTRDVSSAREQEQSKTCSPSQTRLPTAEEHPGVPSATENGHRTEYL
ncbi:hypothetical protein B5807_06867 [Epicoccum nigrum]|uniref:Uncharacterized protein n=1 Tax=Epicoccum nigrum TaxID=105696 RepID=A0A1Y2LZ06_EPING|nr:hypothetical protein B5807_06867 [Epicoccum nigrum]